MIDPDKHINRAKYSVEQTPFLLVFLGIAIYFWINGSSHFENWGSTYGQIIPVYIMMTVVFYLFARKNAQTQLKEPLEKSAINYFIGLFACLIVMTGLIWLGVFSPGKISTDLIFQTLILQLCVVSVAEELIFRGVILETTNSIIASSAIFAVFHSASYGVLWYNFDPATMLGSLLFAFAFGLVLAAIVKWKPKRFNIGLIGVVAIHGMYNCVILGIFVL